MDKVEYIRDNVDQRTLLEQLAEESAELTQAALKLIRALGLSNNPTPVTAEQAYLNVTEEVGDVELLLSILEIRKYEIRDMFKLDRWVKRLNEDS